MNSNRTIMILTLAFACCFIVLLQACKDVCSCKKVTCPAYTNANFDQWFPYTAAQQVIYMDTAHQQNNDTITITDLTATQAYEANKGCYNGASGCSSDKYIYSNNFSVNYNAAADWDGVAIDSNYSLKVYDFSVTAGRLSNTGFGNTSLPEAFYPMLSLNSKDYQNVQVIYRQDTAAIKGEGISEIYLQKNTGLLAYRYYPSQTLFVRK